jgi:hypothetical protein
MAERKPKQPGVEPQYPNVAKWVKDYGRIEVGNHEWEGFQARALDEGGLIYENSDCDSLAGAMQALEEELRAWFKEQDR